MLGREKSQDEAPAAEPAEVEKAKRRSKLERLKGLAARLIAERAEIDAKVPALKEEEMRLRREAVRQDPDKRSTWKGAVGEAHQIQLTRRKLEDSIPSLDEEIALVAGELEVLRAEEAQAVFEEARAGLTWFDGAEDEWKARLVEHHQGYLALIEEGRALCAERRAYPSRYSLADQGQINQLRAAAEPKWNVPAWDGDVFKAIDAASVEPPVVNVRSEFNLHANPDVSLAELSSHYSRIAAAVNAGNSTQELPPAPGAPEKSRQVLPEPEPVLGA